MILRAKKTILAGRHEQITYKEKVFKSLEKFNLDGLRFDIKDKIKKNMTKM